MTESLGTEPSVQPDSPVADLAPPGWLCPFCPLHCESAGLERGADGRLALRDWPCTRAEMGLALAGAGSPASPTSRATPLVNGQAVSLEHALKVAAEHLRNARLPLFGGLATDVAGMRALVRLANLTGGVLDHAHGDALMAGVRLLQDRGQFNTTLGELHSRADLVLCVGTQPGARMPAFWRRVGIARAPESTPPQDASAPVRRVLFFGSEIDPALIVALAGSAATIAKAHAPGHDLHTSLALLNAAALGRPVTLPAPLAAVLAALQAARYTVILWEPAQASADGADAALLAEALLRLTRTLNKTTRAGVIALGGADGVQAVNQTHTWLTGLPLRTCLPALGSGQGMTHDPVLLGGARLWRDAAVDALVWVAATGTHLPPLDARPGVPRIVISHPALAATCAQPGTVYLPVAMAGVGAAGHDWRVDGFVALPLAPLAVDTVDRGLPTVADMATALGLALRSTELIP